MNLSVLLQKLIYDRDAGEFQWRPEVRTYGGKRAGRLTTSGYRQISSGKATVHVHRLVWFAETGMEPIGDIDHVNRNKLDNRFSNLREATRSENCINAPAKVTNKLGTRGVTFDAKKRLYRARVAKDGKRYNCGRHKTLEAAKAAYAAKARELFGEFAPVAEAA